MRLRSLNYGSGRCDCHRAKRRSALIERIDVAVTPIFAGRIESFDPEAAITFADHASAAKARGALAKGFAVAIRDAALFKAMGVEVINPTS